MFITISPSKYLFFKLLLSLYLIYFFTGLIGHSYFILDRHGLFEANTSFFQYNFLFLLKNSLEYDILFIILTLLSVSLLFIKKNLYICLILFYFWICIFSRIPFYIPPPNIGYLGFILLYLTQVITKNNKVYITSFLKKWLWIIIGASYTASGIGKLMSLTWSSGSTLITVIKSPLGQETFFTHFLLSMPSQFQIGITLMVLFSEVFFLPLALFKKTRFMALLLMTITHFGILSTLNIQDIPIGLLIIHFFLIDEDWFKPSKLLKISGKSNNNFINFIKKEDFYKKIDYTLQDVDFMIEYEGQSFKGLYAKIISLSYTNGFWALLRPFILLRRFYGNSR